MTTASSVTCCVCGIALPNKWAVAKRETVAGETWCYCHLHADGQFGKKTGNGKGEPMVGKEKDDVTAQEREIVERASGERVKNAWTECTSLAARLGGGVKALWAKIRPDRSPAAMLDALNGDLSDNRKRLDEMKPQLDRVYREIVEKKNAYQSAPPVRQRLLKTELQTLMARYKGLEREFTILCENERSIETVKSRFLEVLAYGLRGKLDVSMVDRLADDVDDKAEDAEDVQDALADLERAGKRTDRDADGFDAELAGFDGELGFSDQENSDDNSIKENENEKENDDIVRDGGLIA